MRRRTRLTVLACAAALALAAAALASASYAPSMGVFQETYRPKARGAVTIVVAQQKANDPTAKITIYVAPGYKVTLTQPVGRTIGSVLAHVQVLDVGPKAVPVAGAVRVDNPANYVANTCSPGRHEAVWLLETTLPSQPRNPIPVYVDHTTGREAAFSSAKMQLCFRPPDVPPGSPSRSPNGIKFLDATITASGIFRNPRGAGNALWRAVFTPYNPGLGTMNVPGTREAQGVVPMPYSISLKRVKARRGSFRLAGTLNLVGGAPSGIDLALFAGVRTKGSVRFKAVATTKTRRGAYVFSRPLPRKVTYYFVERPAGARTCAATAFGVPCTSATASPTTSGVIAIAPPTGRHS
jgi:hypothetical protein